LSARAVDTALALKFVYDLDGKKATLISVSDDISIVDYRKARGAQ
jgi:hypothetical protein